MATVFERLKKVIVEQLGVEDKEIVPAASFVDDWGAHFLCRVELIVSLEDESSSPSRKIEISDEDAEKIETVQDVVDYLQGLGLMEA